MLKISKAFEDQGISFYALLDKKTDSINQADMLDFQTNMKPDKRKKADMLDLQSQKDMLDFQMNEKNGRDNESRPCPSKN